jgi:hypothetical protein
VSCPEFRSGRRRGCGAYLGGVGGPVAGGGALPGDRDADVDSEQAGQDGGGQVGGELEQRGRACLAGADTELAQAFGELEGADRLAWVAAGEQPRRAALVAEGGSAATAAVPGPIAAGAADASASSWSLIMAGW